jgi:hypothetical protein
MPLGSKLDDPTIACVLAWITEQAPGSGNGDVTPDAGGGWDAVADGWVLPESGP